jgi:hypothetical protein
MEFIAHVRIDGCGLPPSHELDAMIAARQIPRKFIGLRAEHALPLMKPRRYH